jgi:nitrogen regulatory protein P-II 1
MRKQMHYMIFFVLDDANRTEDILEAWEKVGVPGATVLESTGMGRLLKAGLRDDIPLMPSLRDFYRSGGSHNRTLFSIIDDKDKVPELLKATEEVVGDLSNPDTGVLFVLPVAEAYGLAKK